MSFLHPLALLGLAAAAIPALLHLLQRRVPPEVEFPPIRYLTEAERQSARRLKLRHLLLLILRTALVVVVVLAAARPLVPVAGTGGAHEPTAIAIILDNSLSSGAVVDGRPALDRLRAAARAALARTAPEDRAWLILADGIVRRGSREDLLASVDSVAPGFQRLDLVLAVQRAALLVNAEPLENREVLVLSDLQATALADGRAAVPAGVRVLATLADEPAPNRGLADVRVVDGAAVVTIAGSGAPEPATISLRVAGRGWTGGEARALAPAGATVSMPLPPGTAAPGWWLGEVVLTPDELRADDRRLVAWKVAEPARVVDLGTGPFVAAALDVLREAGRIRTGGRTDVVIGDAASPLPARGDVRAVILPPADPALLGQANRALAARQADWRWGTAKGTPGPIDGAEHIAGVQVTQRYRLEPTAPSPGGGGGVLATVNGEPWLVRAGDGSIVIVASRLDTAWTAAPATPGFVPFVDALVNRIVAGQADVARAEGEPRVEFQRVGADTVGATVFGPDARESDLTRVSAVGARAALGGPAAVELVEASRFADAVFAGTRRADISNMLLLLALALAVVELGVATRTR